MNLTAKDIIDIIKECKGSVLKLELSDNTIKVEFISNQIETDNSTTAQPTPVDTPNDPVIYTDIKFAPEKSDELDDEENYLDDLRITDPLKYEELVALGEIENVENNSRS